ncbi:hypothetical protein [Bradyrhizobium lablabi]|uniref:D-alanine--D-alanine ligase family protein n=1 Tax=Bradyrhizobium lablabi TaxID=722472 RepID=UPI001BA5DDDE|nr:hypothetical protein [Bradyrhizobium lablabi]MBR0696575.1 hypothetical protein [Bradyrhizobium lablabi]
MVAALLNLGYRRARFIDTKAPDFLELLSTISVALIAQFGMFGDDGSLQGTLATLNIPYSGAGILASAISTDKVISKRLFREAGLSTPDFCVFDPTLDSVDAARLITRELEFPLVTKPVRMGGSYGIRLAVNGDDLVRNLEQSSEFRPLFAETYVPGQDLTVTLLSNCEGRLEVLPVLELRYAPGVSLPTAENLLGPEAVRRQIPAQITAELEQDTQKMALSAFEIIGAHGFGRIDFKLDRDNQLWVLEANLLPFFGPRSDMAFAAAAHGIEYEDLVGRILNTALTRPIGRN